MLFSGEKLEAISLMATGVSRRINPNLWIGVNPVIKCVSLRVLMLDHVNVSEHVLHKLLSACRLLEKVVLCSCRGLKTVKVKNLGCLRELEITSVEEDGRVEIDKVPSLSLFSYKSVYGCWDEPLPFKTTDATVSSLGGSVTRLHLEGVIIDDTFWNMIATKFPFLERLELQIGYWGSKRLVITSLSLKRLALCFLREDREIDLQVSAPNLLSFDYNGKTLPTLLCPYIGPKQIKLTLNLLRNSLDISFFYKLREVLSLSSKFEIHINLEDSGHDTSFLLNNDDDVDDLRRWVSLSAANVQQLSLKAGSDDCLWDDTRFFDALFSVCHPVHVKALLSDDNKCFSKLMARWMMEKKTNDLKDVQLKNCISGRWEPLTSSWERDVLDTLAETYDVEFKLDWFSDE